MPGTLHSLHRARPRLMHSAGASILVLLALLALPGCSRQSPTSPRATTAIAPGTASEALIATTPVHLEGELGPGALYALDVPDPWNGDLVVYLHGYTNPAFPVALPNNGAVRDRLLAAGFAVAASSYSSNGYAVPEGVRQSHQLRGLFVTRVAEPKRTFLFGTSLGGLIGLIMAEKYGTQFAGALLVSGIVGGSAPEVQYLCDAKVLYDWAYPQLHLGGLVTPIPVTDFNAQVVAPAQAAFLADPARLFYANAVTRHPLPGDNPTEIFTSMVNVLGFQMQGAVDLQDRTNGHMFFDNDNYLYSGALPAALLTDINMNVARFASRPDAEAWLAHYTAPTGDLRFPVLTLHNARDPVVPAFHEGLLADVVHAKGRDAWLAQRLVPTYGHVNFTPDVLVANFMDLVHWVDTGVRPTP